MIKNINIDEGTHQRLSALKNQMEDEATKHLRIPVIMSFSKVIDRLIMDRNEYQKIIEGVA